MSMQIALEQAERATGSAKAQRAALKEAAASEKARKGQAKARLASSERRDGFFARISAARCLQGLLVEELLDRRRGTTVEWISQEVAAFNAETPAWMLDKGACGSAGLTRTFRPIRVTDVLNIAEKRWAEENEGNVVALGSSKGRLFAFSPKEQRVIVRAALGIAPTKSA